MIERAREVATAATAGQHFPREEPTPQRGGHRRANAWQHARRHPDPFDTNGGHAMTVGFTAPTAAESTRSHLNTGTAVGLDTDIAAALCLPE